MGSNRHYPEEKPERQVTVASFWLDTHPVRNSDFRAFVQATGHVTVAEQVGHSHVFHMSDTPIPLNNPDLWWRAVPGACWHQPRPGSELPAGFEDMPVVHIALGDAKAYASWRNARLPTEQEWEFAARGGYANTEFAWGDDFTPQGQKMAHVWRGAFPWYYAPGGEPGPLPVGQFPPNGYGLFDTIGNVWEWTSSAFDSPGACCSCSPQHDSAIRFTLKGGSYLCAAEYCLRYRPPARMGLAAGSTTGHIGFRCAHG